MFKQKTLDLDIRVVDNQVQGLLFKVLSLGNYTETP